MSHAPSERGPSPTAALLLQVNGEARVLPEGSSVADLLVELELGERKVAVAVNREVIPRSACAARRLASGDRIEILEAVGGG